MKYVDVSLAFGLDSVAMVFIFLCLLRMDDECGHWVYFMLSRRSGLPVKENAHSTKIFTASPDTKDTRYLRC